MSSSKETIVIRLCDWTKKKREVEESIEWLESDVGGKDWSNRRIVIGQKSERVKNCEMNGGNGLEVKLRSGGAI